jgi:hypothetical protein
MDRRMGRGTGLRSSKRSGLMCELWHCLDRVTVHLLLSASLASMAYTLVHRANSFCKTLAILFRIPSFVSE